MKTGGFLYVACSSALALLGFGSCDENGVEEYGTPHADFSIKGAVQSTDGKAIQGIKVSLLDTHNATSTDEIPDTLGTVYSDEKGMYSIEKEAFPKEELTVTAEDVDGEKNGSYEKKSVSFKISQKDYKGGGKSWYNGKVEKDINLQLDKKKDE